MSRVSGNNSNADTTTSEEPRDTLSTARLTPRPQTQGPRSGWAPEKDK